ncbi:hypothetical protein PROFUN_13397 [Planoprotostelium fungivorum]|uniref:Uncharacterized protein n=1 Tax=Planoprotostelium fungivorum TaxID=1890364 RepID=A0A2P6N3N9_9EUKA|nr:hypothetical protein PROFUN_13397 [Planoprotostelium fungivorum]
MDYDFVKTFPVKVTEPKAFDELPISKLLNYLTQDKIIELIGFPNFNSLNEQVRQQTGKVSLPAVKKMLADNVSWLMNKPKKQFLGCVAKHTPPEYKIVPYSGLRNSAYERQLNAGHTNRATVLRPPPGMKIQHLPNR